MNLSLLDPFQDDLPEVIEEYLDYGVAKCISFNRRGTFLAAGCSDGSCLIWDFGTRGVAKKLKSSECSSPITSVSWSKNGHHILAASVDCSLALWDVAGGTRTAVVSFQTAVMHARLQPGDSNLCLACPVESPPLLVDLITHEKIQLPVTSSKCSEAAVSARGKNSDISIASPAAATFSKLGDIVYVGTVRGEILVVSVKSRQLLSSLQVQGGAWIKQLQISRNGQFLLANSNDRVIRVFEVSEDTSKKSKENNGCGANDSADDATENHVSAGSKVKLLKDYQDAVNKLQWKSACFSGNGEYVAGAAANRGEHKIQIFSRGFGQLARILEGPKEAVTDMAWHPTRPIVASVSQSGLIYLWAKDYVENWSAFAPDFKELENNEEYVEREDEFDIVPDEEKVKPTKSADENQDVDIETVEKIAAFSDSDDSEQGLYFLPTAPEPDERPDFVEGEEGPEIEGPIVVEGQSGNFEDAFPTQSHLERDTQRGGRISGDFENEEETPQNGRRVRKRKLSEKAAELEAEKESAKKGARNNSGGKKGSQP